MPRHQVINKNILCLEYKAKDMMADTFMRFQEHYESPVFKGKYFTREEFVNWYKSTYESDYLLDWEGFNFPDYVVLPFLHGKFSPMSVKEHFMLDMIHNNFLKNDIDKFYVIGYLEGDMETKGHELAHAMYYLNESYRSVAKELVNTGFKDVKDLLTLIGYHKDVLEDETQAYLMFDQEFLKSEGIDTGKYQDTINKLLDNFNIHIGVMNG